ncbi:uncharacterized protein PV09_03567 [Verruconis gallopava]|uniref:tripeptidyl-peptidase II n=1 Tax=Verruconis gallopava TaxID=253628 RepID=A0A0D1YYC2_9PEZI|nr:uncharacterized protein PV09_03567 [Verruconis gallopava]KIW05707.1 hypothetical protein PV09_03567 [Verruconis gallopava]
MIASPLLLFLVALGDALAVNSTARSAYSLKERHHVPPGWRNVGDAPRDAKIALRVALRQRNWTELEKELLEGLIDASTVSDPHNQKYGQHLSGAQVRDFIRPTDETSDLVHEWLAEHGHVASLQYSPAKDWITLTLPVFEAERLLDTRYSVFRHIDGSELIRAPQWSLPAHLHDHVDTIQPTTSFFRFQRQAVQWLQSPVMPAAEFDIKPQSAIAATGLSVSAIEKVCNASNITPECLSTLYGTIDYTPKGGGKSKIGYCNYLEETTIATDLAMFVDTYKPQAKGTSIDIRIVNNGENQQVLDAAKLNATADVEGNLDGQTIVGQVYPIPVVAYNTGGRPPVTTPYIPAPGKNVTNEPYLEWLDYMQGLADGDLPTTISTSYGDDEQSVPPSYASKVCQSFAQLGSRGVTLLFSSGDSGVGNRSPTSDRCEIYPDPEVAANAVPNFMPAFPASCPYVTTVGATKGLGSSNFSTEVAAGYPANISNYASGGGFSNYFSRPAWQDSVVSAYMKGLTSNEVDPAMYNHSGRAYPDLAANGQHYSIVYDQKFIRVDGTSASSPMMASVIALLNDDLLANGKPPLGFMNPWLYSIGKDGFTDIISGSAKGCGVEGFPAKPGWDAVTGFGTPNFVKLRELVGTQARQASSLADAGFIDKDARS